MRSQIIIATLLFAGFAVGCRSTPITGRRQVLLVPESSEISMGLQAYTDTVSTQKASANERWSEMVERVGRRIAEVADRPDYQWEFRLLASPEMNAFALPGGKVAIYEGILPICQNEAGLAVVMSHEIAHALARHGGERMSQETLVSGVSNVVNWAMRNRTSAVTQQRVAQAFGIASKYGVVLPYSRKHESEADHMGMILMARAGYDPREAPLFWQRFGQAQSGEQPIEFLSTHPADARRASDLNKLLPEAMKYYEAAPVRLGMGDDLGVRLADLLRPRQTAASQ